MWVSTKVSVRRSGVRMSSSSIGGCRRLYRFGGRSRRQGRSGFLLAGAGTGDPRTRAVFPRSAAMVGRREEADCEVGKHRASSRAVARTRPGLVLRGGEPCLPVPIRTFSGNPGTTPPRGGKPADPTFCVAADSVHEISGFLAIAPRNRPEAAVDEPRRRAYHHLARYDLGRAIHKPALRNCAKCFGPQRVPPPPRDLR